MFAWLRPRPHITTPATLEAAFSRHGAFVAQRAAVTYCMAKAGMRDSLLMSEVAFRSALEVCRWRCFFAVVADLAAASEAWLRPQARHEELRLAQGLAAIAERAVRAQEAPEPVRAYRDAAMTGLPARLARLQLAAPKAADTIELAAAPVLLETLPIHPSLRRHDDEPILGGLRFLFISAMEGIEKAADARVLAAAILAESDQA